jgi:HK97 family phage major capsid protein
MAVYNAIISRSDIASLIPEDVASDIIGHVVTQSAALSLFRHVPSRVRSGGCHRSAAGRVLINPSDTGLKQTSEAAWANQYLNAEEIAALVPIPEAVLDDTSFDVWAQIRPLLEEAIGRCLDAAVFFGTGKPSSWPTDILAAATASGNVVTEGANAAAAGGIAGDISDLLSVVEADGFDPNGIAANRTLRGKLRNARATTGEQLATASGSSVAGVPSNEIYGVPVTYPLRGLWPTGLSKAQAFAGDFSEGILGVRQDITYKILDQAVIQDGTGAIQFNLAQQDMVAMRVVCRFGWAVKNSMTPEGAAGRYPFSVLLTKAT